VSGMGGYTSKCEKSQNHCTLMYNIQCTEIVIEDTVTYDNEIFMFLVMKVFPNTDSARTHFTVL